MAFTIVFILSLLLIQDVVQCKAEASESTGFCEQFVNSNQYACSEAMVETSDGYLLALQKITNSKGKKTTKSQTKAPVLLHHGLMQGGETWVLNSINNSLAFMMADAGYEVWIGNSRTCKYTFGHLKYSKTDEEFWDWTWDDLVKTDLPTMVQFVHDQSKQPIYYVGYSQGTMSALAALSKGTLVNPISKAALLAPIGSLGHVTSAVIKVGSLALVDQALLLAGVTYFNAKDEVGQRFLDLVCTSSEVDCKVDLMSQITGNNCCVDKSKLAYNEEHSLQPTSMKNLAHLAQMVRSGKFRKYDYGALDNVNEYNSPAPPEYDISKISKSLPILLVHGGKDMLASPQDVALLIKKLPKKPQVINLSKYAHGDFIMGTSAGIDVYNPIIKFFQH